MVLVLGTPASVGWSVSLNQVGNSRPSYSISGLRGHQRLVIRAKGRSLTPTSGLIIGMDYAYTSGTTKRGPGSSIERHAGVPSTRTIKK